MGSTTDEPGRTKRVAKWYHGGLASASAAMCTHPLDLLKVHLQTQQKVQLGLVGKYRTAIHAYSLVKDAVTQFIITATSPLAGTGCLCYKVSGRSCAALSLYILCNRRIQQGVKLLCFN